MISQSNTISSVKSNSKSLISNASRYPPDSHDYTISNLDIFGAAPTFEENSLNQHAKNPNTCTVSTDNFNPREPPVGAVPHSQTQPNEEKINEDEDIPIGKSITLNILKAANTLNYDIMNIGFGKEFISGASGFPPELDLLYHDITVLEDIDFNDTAIINNFNYEINCENFISDSITSINEVQRDGETIPLCTITSAAQLCLTEDYYDDITYSINNINVTNAIETDQHFIKSTLVKWWIRVPIRLPNNNVIWIKMLADTGANAACIDSDFAYKYFRKFIYTNIDKCTLHTPGGRVTPKFCVYFAFPLKNGNFLKAKLYIVNDLPVPIICDLNMLLAFGYRFEKDQIPPIFRHTSEPDIDMELVGFDEIYSINKPTKKYQRGNDISDKNDDIMTESKPDTNIKSNNCMDYSNLTYTFDEYKQSKHKKFENQTNQIHSEYTELPMCEQIGYGSDTSYHYALGSVTPAPSSISNATQEMSIEDRLNEFTPSMIKSLKESNQDFTVNDIFSNIDILDTVESSDKLINLSKDILNDPLSIDDILSVKTTDLKFSNEIIDTVNNINHYNSNAESVQDQLRTENDIFKCLQNGHFGGPAYVPHAPVVTNVHSNKIRKLIKYNLGYNKIKFNMASRRIGKLSNINFNIIQEPRIKKLNFIIANKTYLATQREIDEAQAHDYNPYLKHNDISYLKEYPTKYGIRFQGLYEEMLKLRQEFEDVFAKREYDRRTMFVPPVRLGVLPQHRHKTCYAPQYPLTKEQRRYMINYTIEGRKNGFWKWVRSSLHCLPHTMVAKKDKDGKIIKMRPAFDARIINAICELFPATMPTIKDFDDLFSIKGFFTLADIKNMFNNIPLDLRDQLWAIVLTPLGLYQMLHLEYGFKNAAQNAQNIMNIMCLHVILMIVYIDDIIMKHYYFWGTKQLIQHQRKFLQYCRDKNLLLNPKKYWPFVAECTNFGYKRTLEGSTVSDGYKQKVIKFAKPQTVRQMKEFLGIIGYIARYIYNGNKISYWLNQLTIGLENKRTLQWTPQANTAFAQLLYLTKKAPILHNPSKMGIFCIKCDASTYGAGAVLYQQQKIAYTRQYKWVIIDMHSSQTPERLRHAHAMVHEARAVVLACQHWLFHLIKQPFIIATDNKPVSQLFTEEYRKLSDITQKQILRLRIAISPLTYQMRHVEGLHNEVADGLSRFTMLLSGLSGFADMTEAIKPTDVKGDRLTEEQVKQLLKESELLRIKQRELSQNNSIINLTPHLTSDYSNIQKYNIITSMQNKEFRNTKAMFSRAALNSERIRINQYLQSANHSNVLMSDEYNFNTPPINNLYDEIKDLQSILNNLTINTCKTICSISRKVLKQCQFYDNIISTEYDINSRNKTDGTITVDGKRFHNIADGSTIRQANMQTRSKTKQTNKNKVYRVDYIPPEYNKIAQNMKIRSEVMHDLYGYRANTNLFTIKNILRYQKSDNELNLVRYLYKVLMKNGYDTYHDKIKQDVTKLSKMNFTYYSHLINKEIKINEESGILFVKVMDTTLRKFQFRIMVPVALRGKYMDWAHHNVNSQHLHYSQSLYKLSKTYYWDTMVNDIKTFCKRCLICDFVKGTKRHRAPLQIREQVSPREHLMFDFIGSIYGKYYILALIDYCTGYTMLIPTVGTDVQTVVYCILQYWIPVFGKFKYLDCDYGPGFTNKVFRALMKAQAVNLQFAEPKNHRSIGKIERVIGFVQSILQRYNIMLDEQLIDLNDIKRNWLTIQTLLPHIQAAINQRRPRFTTFSPNMLMFGTNVRDLSDIDSLISSMEDIYKDNTDYSASSKDYVYVQQLLHKLRKIYKSFNEDWMKYVRISKKQYDNKYNINDRTIKRNRKLFIQGKRVLYFIGDKYTAQQKWRRKWTGPWVITHVLNDSTVIIADPETGNQKRVSIDRLKLFKITDTIPYQKYINDNNYKFDRFQDSLKHMLYRYDVKTELPSYNLDYRTRTSQS